MPQTPWLFVVRHPALFNAIQLRTRVHSPIYDELSELFGVLAQLAIQRLSSRVILGKRSQHDEKFGSLDPQTFFLWKLVCHCVFLRPKPSCYQLFLNMRHAVKGIDSGKRTFLPLGKSLEERVPGLSCTLLPRGRVAASARSAADSFLAISNKLRSGSASRLRRGSVGM
jgi:hypothetical protein